MNRSSLFPALIVLLAAAAAFILLSGRSLPPVVATHFAASGRADGFMPRNSYLTLMLFIAVAVPLLLALGLSSVRFVPPQYFSLPNREYWLAPERRDETFAFMHNHGMYLSALLAAFLCFVHWLVVLANEMPSPRFSPPLFVAGLILFLSAVTVLVMVFFVHFRRRP